VVAFCAVVVLATGCGDDAEPAPTSTAPPPSTVAFGPDRGNGVLQVGVARLGDAQVAAVELALEDVGSVLDRPVRRDDRHPDVVVGTGEPRDGLVWIAPSGPDSDGELVVRTGAGDDLLAQAVVDLVVEDGHAGATVVGDSDLAAAIDAGLDDDPGATVLVDAGDPEFDGDTPTYLVGGPNDTDAGAPEGTKVVVPGAEVSGDLLGRLPAGADPTGAAEAYDAVVIAALAAEAAATDDPQRLAAQIPGVTQGGATCLSFVECRALIADGEDVDYDGLGGSDAIGGDGRPTESAVTVLEYAADGHLDPNRTEYRSVTAP
jgi:hypothetical protein